MRRIVKQEINSLFPWEKFIYFINLCYILENQYKKLGLK